MARALWWSAAAAMVLAGSVLVPWITVRGTTGEFRASLLYSSSPEWFPLIALGLVILAGIHAWRRWVWAVELMRLLSLLAAVAVIPLVQQYGRMSRSGRSLDIAASGLHQLVGEPVSATMSLGPWLAVAAAASCYWSIRTLPAKPWPSWSVYALLATIYVGGTRTDHLYLFDMMTAGAIRPNQGIASTAWLRHLTRLQTDAFQETRTPLVSERMAPNFSLKTITGEQLELAQFRGKRVLVNFWATWCGPCIYEMPAIEKLYQRHRDDEFVVLAISVDEQPEKVAPFMKKYQLSFPALFSSLAVERDYGVSAYPTSFMIEADGRIAWSTVGGLSPDRIQHVEDMLQVRR